MSLREAAAAMGPLTIRSRSCGVYLARQELTGDDLAWLNEVVDNPRIAATNIARIVKGTVDLTAGMVQRHRRRECKCP